METAMDRYDGYSVHLFLDEDGDWIAALAEMPTVSAFGPSPEEALAELDTAWAAVKESYASRGEKIPTAPSRRQYSGRFNVRVDRERHRDLAVEAARRGVSLNALVARKLAASIDPEAKSAG